MLVFGYYLATYIKTKKRLLNKLELIKLATKLFTANVFTLIDPGHNWFISYPGQRC